MGRADKAGIAASAAPALGNHDFLAVVTQVSEQFLGIGITNHSAYRHTQHDVIGTATMLLGTGAMFPAFALIVGLIAEINQGAQSFISAQNDGAAAAAVTAGRTALWHIFFAAEGNNAIAAVTGLYVDLCVIIKHGHPPFLSQGLHRPKGLQCASNVWHWWSCSGPDGSYNQRRWRRLHNVLQNDSSCR